MERSKIILDELKKWKDKFVTEHKMWRNELETAQEGLLEQCLLTRESKRRVEMNLITSSHS